MWCEFGGGGGGGSYKSADAYGFGVDFSAGGALDFEGVPEGVFFCVGWAEVCYSVWDGCKL